MTDRTTPQEASRAAFEAWAKKRGEQVTRAANGPYIWDATDDAWKIWQAATQARDADAKVLIERASRQLRAWHAKYGEHRPGWLPPSGDVDWLEDANDYLKDPQQ